MYLRLREHSAELDGPPVTVRQLESLVRLAEARARLDLREVVTEDDARVRMRGGGDNDREDGPLAISRVNLLFPR